MSVIEVKFDPVIAMPEIRQVIVSPGEGEAPDGQAPEDSFIQTTKVNGILAPLVKIQDYVVPFHDIEYMVLSCEKMPMLKLKVRDSLETLEIFNRASGDNTVQIQILPQFDGAYRKIDLMFYMTGHTVSKDVVEISAVYKIPRLYDNVMKAYGKITTYKFFESVARELGLGFASNLSDTDDARWIYCASEKMSAALSREASFGGSSDVILDWWIDYWNNLNLVDVRERMMTIDPVEDMTVWTTGSKVPVSDPETNLDPVEIQSMITNSIAFTNMGVYADEYTTVDRFSSNLQGTDRVFSYWSTVDSFEDSWLVQDGDIENDISIGFEYLGENFGEHLYLKNDACRRMWQAKMSTTAIQTDLTVPCLGFARGSKVNFYWFRDNYIARDIKYANASTNIGSVSDSSDISTEDSIEEDVQILDKQISGQYYIQDANIYFSNSGGSYLWDHEIVLSRPADQEQKITVADIGINTGEYE